MNRKFVVHAIRLYPKQNSIIFLKWLNRTFLLLYDLKSILSRGFYIRLRSQYNCMCLTLTVVVNVSLSWQRFNLGINHVQGKLDLEYRIYSINRPGLLLNFWTLRVGAHSRWALIRGWALIKFSPLSASAVCLFCNKTINSNNETRRCNKARFL